MKTLNRKLRRELYSAKGLLLAIASIIAVGVTCYVTMQSSYHNLSRAKESYYRRCRMADFWIDLKKAPLTELAAIERLPGVAEAHPRIAFFATVDLENVVEPLNGLVISLPDERQPVVNDIVLRQGGYFTNERRNEVIVNDAFARAHNLYPGQWIHLLLNNRRQELFIVGTAISSEYTYLLGPGALIPDPEHFGVFYVKRLFAEEVFDFEGAANQVVGRLAPEVQANPDEVLRRAETLLDSYGVFNTTPLRLQLSNQFLSSEIEGLGAFATVVPTIFLAVAALVLNVLITRLARQQRTVIGTLKAIGYTDWQVFLHFLLFGLSVGIVGAILGSAAGYGLSMAMTAVYRQYFEFPRLESGFYWYTHGVGLIVSLLCAVLGSSHGALAMVKLQPAAAMRPEPPRQGGAIWLERWQAFWSQLGSGWRMALRNIMRHRLRTLAGLFASCMGACLLVTGLMMAAAQDYLIDFQFHRVSRSDIDLAFSDEQSTAALAEVRSMPGVDLAEPLLDVACTFVNGPYKRKGGVTGLSPGARLSTPRNDQGEPIRIPSSGFVLTRRLAEILHVETGDTITMIPVKGEREPVDVTVAAIADSYFGLAAYAQIDYLSRLIGEEQALTGAQLATDKNPNHVRDLYRRLKESPGVESITARADMVESLTKTLLQNQYVMIGFIVGFSGVIFFGSIVNGSLVGLAERRREAATFRALGYTPWQVGNVFLRENLLTNICGALLGLPAGYLLMMLTAYAYNTDLIRIPVVVTPQVWFITMALAVVFALLAHSVVQWRIHRMDYLEALKVKE